MPSDVAAAAHTEKCKLPDREMQFRPSVPPQVGMERCGRGTHVSPNLIFNPQRKAEIKRASQKLFIKGKWRTVFTVQSSVRVMTRTDLVKAGVLFES